MILYRSCIDLICLFCLCVTVKIQFDNTIVGLILSIHHTHPLHGHYARPRVCSPLFRNSGSAPDIIIYSSYFNSSYYSVECYIFILMST